jgi:hypothetical protein
MALKDDQRNLHDKSISQNYFVYGIMRVVWLNEAIIDKKNG